jgi:mannitol-1-phosphate 5-dehydrogenase
MKNEAEIAPMPEKHALIFGAGKIARGFLAHLLTLSGYRIAFIEKNAELGRLLRARGRYRVHIMGAPEKSIEIAGFAVLEAEDEDAVAAAVARADVIFVSIGGPNLPQIAGPLAAGLRRRGSGINVLLAENYFQPAKWLRGMIAERLSPEERKWFEHEVGIVETLVLRSTIEPTEEMKAEDPLCLKAQDMWELPADKQAFVGAIPQVEGLAPKDNFQCGLVRKLFTYNAINAVIAYQGYLKGFDLLADAANDPELSELARAAARESSAALCSRYGLDPEEQRAFADAAIAKYRKREIVDPIERNTRDPLRKLSRHDRLVGPACLALEQGIFPEALCRGIAAALAYDHPGDPAAVRLQEILRTKGVRGALSEVCGVPADGELADLVAAAYGAAGPGTKDRAR